MRILSFDSSDSSRLSLHLLAKIIQLINLLEEQKIFDSMRRHLKSRVSIVFFLCCIFLSWFAEFVSMATVTLESVEIFDTHEWFSEPTVYFHCMGERETFLPDVKKAHNLYTFKDEESWQPLTDFPNKKCKRCGFYEKHRVKQDDVFGVWEFCPSDFTAPDGKYIRSVDKEFNATFLCQECVHLGADSIHGSSSQNGGHGMHWGIVILISVLASTVFNVGLVAGYKYWQKKKSVKNQARFVKTV